MIKAIIFDIGGVCVGSPMEGIHTYEKNYGLPRNYLNVAIVKQGENGAFQKLERGEIQLEAFYEDFGRQLSNPIHKEHYKQYLAKSGEKIPETIPDITVDGKLLFKTMMIEGTRLDPHMFSALERLKASGKYIVAALTNNFDLPKDDLKEAESLGGGSALVLREIFDYFIESRLVGLRKPDPKIFLYACEHMGIQPEEAIFLDDIGINLKSAKQLGMTTIHVKIGQSKKAIKQLEELTGIDLLYARL